MERPDKCPNCGKSCRSHTGPYCHECGEPLIEGRKRPVMKQLTHAEVMAHKDKSRLRRS